MFFRTSIIFGFIRLCLLVFLIFYVNKKMFIRFKTQNLLEFIVNKWFKYGSILLIMVFVMIQLGVYNFLNLLFLLSLLLLLDYIGLRNIKRPKKYITNQINLQALEVLKNIENKKPLSFWLRLDKDSNLQKRDLQMIFIVSSLIFLQFLTKYYIFNFDVFSFSKLWYSNLGSIIDFDSQLWFSNENRTLGQSALINIYSQTVNVSPEVALQSISILEDSLLCVTLFWVVFQITSSKFVAPVIAALFFIFAHTIIPINIEFVLKNNPIFSALTLAIPAMVYTLKPNALNLKKHNYFILLTLCFVAIGLINLVVLLICFPLFILITLLLNCKKDNDYYWISLVSYLSGTFVILMIYAITCYHLKTDFVYFLHSNLVSTHTFTYLPHLEYPYNDLMLFYQINSGIGILVMLLFTWIKKENWKIPLVFMFFFNGLLLLSHINNNWLDTDLIITMIPIFLPLTIGINSALIIKLIDPIFKEKFILSKLFYGIMIIGFVVLLIKIQLGTIMKLAVTDRTPTTVLNAYDEISESYIPYTYAVVNDNSAQLMSTNQHYFINYDYFLDNYIYRDSIYNKNKKDPHFFQKKPQFVLPNSIFVFVYNPDKIKVGSVLGESSRKDPKNKILDIDDPESFFSEGSRNTPKLLAIINKLKQKGREINLYYDSDIVKVYEIVNVPKRSKTEDLIYEK